MAFLMKKDKHIDKTDKAKAFKYGQCLGVKCIIGSCKTSLYDQKVVLFQSWKINRFQSKYEEQRKSQYTKSKKNLLSRQEQGPMMDVDNDQLSLDQEKIFQMITEDTANQ